MNILRSSIIGWPHANTCSTHLQRTAFFSNIKVADKSMLTFKHMCFSFSVFTVSGGHRALFSIYIELIYLYHSD